MDLLAGRIRDYAWGSREAIARIQGRPFPTPDPEAELWMGAHHGAPATLLRESGEVSLIDALAADPATLLGPVAPAGDAPARLPYLFKVLAAEQPLSLQAHPDPEQARTRYAAERAAGATEFNYSDPYPKPELLVAVEDFDALCGFREPELSAQAIESLGVDALKPVIEALRTGDEETRLRTALDMIMTWPVVDRAALVASVTQAGHSGSSPAHHLVADLGTRYPGDLGVVAALLLNQVRLAPDEAVWMPAGNLHAYLHGTGMEIMAASDNVLRGGLTPKRIDVDELMRIVRFEVLDEPVVRPVTLAPGLLGWPVPTGEFSLCKADPDGTTVRLPANGPRIVFCLRGHVELDTGAQRLPLSAGRAAFVAGTEPEVVVGGTGQAFQADIG